MASAADSTTAADIASILRHINLDEAAGIVEENQLDGATMLSLLDDESLNELSVATALQKLKFRCLFKRHLLQSAVIFPPERVIEFFKGKPVLHPSIEVNIHFCNIVYQF